MRRIISRLPVPAIVLALLLAAPAGGAKPAALHRVALGVAVADPTQLTAALGALGRRPALVTWYQAWDEPVFYASQLRAVRRLGATPIVTWIPKGRRGLSFAAIAAGRWDGYLRRSARQVRRAKRLIYLRFAHEMNLPSEYHGIRPRRFVAAWRHVVRVFRRAHVGNVRWIWSPNVDCDRRCPFTAFFPGDRWVDRVALDGYNVGTTAAGSRWTPFRTVFGRSYRTLARLSRRPMMIGETASTEAGGDKAAWILTALLGDVPLRFPRLVAVTWFDRDKETDWQIASSVGAQAAFGLVAASPLYGRGRGPLSPAVLARARSLLAGE